MGTEKGSLQKSSDVMIQRNGTTGRGGRAVSLKLITTGLFFVYSTKTFFPFLM
jgi:hypothetical protein